MDATATRNYLLNRILRKGSHVRKFKPSSRFLGFPQTRQPCGQRFMELLMVLQPPRGTLAVWKAGSLSDPNQDSFPFPEHSDSFTSKKILLGSPASIKVANFTGLWAAGHQQPIFTWQVGFTGQPLEKQTRALKAWSQQALSPDAGRGVF